MVYSEHKKNPARALRSKWIYILFALLIIITISGIYMRLFPSQTPPTTLAANLPTFELEKTGRDFGQISIHPNSEDWVFTECSTELNSQGECYVLKFNIRTQQLTRFIMPTGYQYNFTSVSPKGNWILMSRFPNHDGSDEQYRQSLLNGEVVMMHMDGTKFQVLPIPKGRMINPVMSPDENKIAYWKSETQRPTGSKTVVTDFDIHEYDLTTQKNQLFAGEYRFFEAGNVQYMSQDEVLFDSYAPSGVSIWDYAKKFNESHVYRLVRNAAKLPDPSFTSMRSAQNSSIDKNGDIYLQAEIPHQGTSFVKIITSTNDIRSWVVPLTMTEIRDMVVSPDGQYFAFKYVAEGTKSRDHKYAMGILNFNSGKWLPMTITPLQSSTPITVSN